MDCLTSRILLQKICSYKCQFNVWLSSKLVLSSSYDGLAKHKAKAPDVLDPNQNAEKKCNFKLKFKQLKYLLKESVSKTY